MPANKIIDNENYSQKDIQLDSFERQIAQKLMLSIRYFCTDDVEPSQLARNQSSLKRAGDHPSPKEECKQPVTRLPNPLAKLIEETSLGGIVLFAENIESPDQVIQLTHQLQLAASRSALGKPLFIGVDQEGGRVVRLQRQQSTAFSGNMAIGATYPKMGTYYAEQVGRVIATELSALGINLDFAPDVDVNSNPDNPVINVRSFGEQPSMVSKLGIAMMNAMQKQNVIATLKHFPGHGNTNVDSHTGLPVVDNERHIIEETDLLPFKRAIEKAEPGMIMTAHIQYPSLDDSTLVDLNGNSIVKPATMSKVLLTDLLRDDFGFKGVVITDALNMAGISNHFKMSSATATTLLAGADIALMPFRVRTQADIYRFKHFIRAVAMEIKKQPKNIAIVERSLSRIDDLRKKYQLERFSKKYFTAAYLESKFKQADSILANDSSRALQKQLAIDSISLVQNNNNLLPLDQNNADRIHLILQDKQQLSVIAQVLKKYQQQTKKTIKTSYSLLTDFNSAMAEKNIAQSQTVIAFFSSRRESAVVKGEVDDLENIAEDFELQQQRRLAFLKFSLIFAKKQHKNVIVAGMQSPYDMREFSAISDSIIVAYDASIYSKEDKSQIISSGGQEKKILSTETFDESNLVGVTYDAVIQAILGKQPFKGRLPVSLRLTSPHNKTQPAD